MLCYPRPLPAWVCITIRLHIFSSLYLCLLEILSPTSANNRRSRNFPRFVVCVPLETLLCRFSDSARQKLCRSMRAKTPNFTDYRTKPQNNTRMSKHCVNVSERGKSTTLGPIIHRLFVYECCRRIWLRPTIMTADNKALIC